MRPAISCIFVLAVLAASTVSAIVTPSGGDSTHNFDLLKVLNTIACSTSSKHCVRFGEEDIGFPEFRDSLVQGTLEFIHDMIEPKGLQDLFIRKQLPSELQGALDLAKKHRGPAGSGLAGHKASARAVIAAISELRGWSLGANKYAIFGWIPQWAIDVPLGGEGNFATQCLGNITVKVTLPAANSYVTVTTDPSKSGFLCSDFILLNDGSTLTLQMLDNTNIKSWSFETKDLSAAEKWYLQTNGVRIMKFPGSLLDTIGQLLATVEMMAGVLEMPLTNVTLAQNLDFIHNYVQFDQSMHPISGVRTAGSIASQLESEIKSGDAFIILRMDGLDPMISWGEFFVPGGHSVMAMRDANDNLFICESTVKGGYWKLGNGLGCHEYGPWIAAAESAQENILWAPLSAEARQRFNVSQAWDWFNKHKGINYGYVNFLWGWIDTAGHKGTERTNFPCVPGVWGTFDVCLQPESAELLATFVDRILANSNENIFRPGLAHRAGQPITTPVIDSLYYAATQMGKNMSELYTMPEEEDWLYNMTCNPGDNGPESVCNGKTSVLAVSSVCDVFVTRMLKAGGVFSVIDNQINSPEQTLWDLYSLQIWDDNRTGENRPEICKTTDPECPLCQLMGTMTFPNGTAPRGPFTSFNSRPLHPWPGQSSEYCGAPANTGIRDQRC